MRGIHQDTFQHAIQLDWHQSQSNNQIDRFTGNYSYHNRQHNTDDFIVARYHTARLDNTVFANDGMGHVRRMVRWRRDTHPTLPAKLPENRWVEGFVQHQFQNFADLDQRLLVGGGVRYEDLWGSNRYGIRITLGTGVMHEYEQYTGFGSTRLIRGTAYLSLQRTVGNIQLSSTNYYQPRLDSLSDYRILSQSNIDYILNSRVYITLFFNLLFKSVVPETIEPLEQDTGMQIGIRF